MLYSEFFLHPAFARKSRDAQEIQGKFLGKGSSQEKEKGGKQEKAGETLLNFPINRAFGVKVTLKRGFGEI